MMLSQIPLKLLSSSTSGLNEPIVNCIILGFRRKRFSGYQVAVLAIMLVGLPSVKRRSRPWSAFLTSSHSELSKGTSDSFCSTKSICLMRVDMI